MIIPSIRICPVCGKRIPGYELSCRCGHTIIVEESGQFEETNIGVPKWVRAFQYFSKPEDVGLGATIKRIAAKFGGERFKKFADKMGLPCGCTGREEDLNIRYPNPNFFSQNV